MRQDRIIRYLSSLGVGDCERKSGLLERYISEIMLFNPSLKLVGAKDGEDILVRHIFDCASAYPVFESETAEGSTIADLGSGAGLPGIVLAVLFPSRRLFLVERMQRRVGFLRYVTAVLKLDNVTVVDSDMKDAGTGFDTLTCRAFHPLADIAGDAVKLSHRAILYKGTAATTISEMGELEKAGYGFSGRIVPVTVEGLNEERNILILDNWEKK